MGDLPGPSNHPDLESAPPFPLSLPPHSFPSAIKPERVWTVFLVYLLCLIGSILGGGAVFIIAAIAVYGPDVFESSGLLTEAETSPLVANLVFCTVELILLGGAVAAGMLSPVPFARRLRLHSSTAPVVTYPVMLLGVLAVGQTFESATMLLWSDLGPSIDQLHDLIINASGPALLATIVVVGLAPALGEELLCRGYIQTRLSNRWGPAPGVLIASSLFALLHLDLIHGLGAFFIGIYLGFIVERAGSIRPAMFCHALNNMGSVCLTARFPDGAQRETHILLLSIGAVLLVLCTVYILVRTRPKPNDLPRHSPSP